MRMQKFPSWRWKNSLRGVALLAGLVLVAGGARTEAAQAEAPLDDVQTYLNSLTSLTARFLQVSPDGSISEGAMYLARPGGRIRLEYAPPSKLLLVGGDGWITVRDEAAGEDSRWPVGGTPFDALIGDKVDFVKDVVVRDVTRGGGIIRVTVEGRADPGAGSLTLVFSESPIELHQWQIIDSQRLLTTVTLSDVRMNTPVESSLFIQRDPELWSDE
jgi:outer membrane lipoprotein-sorting protein